MWFDQTGVEWINPSPNLQNPNSSLLYPSICLLEATNISVGRGTDQPFEMFGAPWIDAHKLAEALNEANLPGVRFVPRRFRPKAAIYKDQECQGLDIQIVDRKVFDPVLMGMELVAATLKFHPGKVTLTPRLLGSDDVLRRFQAGESGRRILDESKSQLDEFRQIRAKYLIYQ